MREIANAPPPRVSQFDAALRPPLTFDSRLVNIELALFLLRHPAGRNLGGVKVLPRRYPFIPSTSLEYHMPCVPLTFLPRKPATYSPSHVPSQPDDAHSDVCQSKTMLTYLCLVHGWPALAPPLTR